jgi:hypothetical protein
MELRAAVSAVMAALLIAASASAAVIPAASCAQADVQAAINLASDGDTVTVPAGVCTWISAPNTPAVLIDQKAITLQGSGPALTIINDATGTSWGDYAVRVNSGASKPVRITGFRFVNAGGGGVALYGTATGWRIDHCELISPVFSTSVHIDRSVYGVVHSCTFLNARVGTSDGDGHASWKRPLALGGETAVFVESCRFERNVFGNAIDTNHGGRYVFRYNTLINNYVEAHSLQNAVAGYPYGFARATRSYEIYHNAFEAVDNTPTHSNWVALFVRAGTGVVFNNSIVNLGGPPYSQLGAIDNRRSAGAMAAPLLSCDGTNPLDGNQEANGYPCLDQIGRSTDAGPNDQFHVQDLDPLYAWNNTLNGQQRGLVVHNNTGHHIKEGRDFYNFTPRPRYIPHPYPHPLTLGDDPGEQRALALVGSVPAGQANLTWQAVNGAASYRIVRDWNEAGAVVVSTTSWSDPSSGGEHVYMVYALAAAGTILAAEGALVNTGVLPSTRYVPVTPCRVLDTRLASGAGAAAPILGAHERRAFEVASRCGVPAGALAISGNLTVVSAQALGDLRVTGGHLQTTSTSALSIPLSRARANNAIIQLSTSSDGSIAVTNDSGGSVHFILDVNGYFQ